MGDTRKRDPVYLVWKEFRRRCRAETHKRYKDYGGRGISVFPEWDKSFAAFAEYMGPRPIGAQLDRKDNDGNYEPGNVRWVTAVINAQNTRHCKLQAADIPFVRHWSSIGYSGSEIARAFNVDKTTISRVLLNKTWKDV